MEDTTRILWLSRHKVQDNQRKELGQIFDEDYKIIVRKTTVSSAEDIVNLMEENNCDEVVPVVPHAIRRKLVNDLGVQYLYSETMKVNRDGPPVYKHLKFYRVKAEQELLDPTA